MINGEIQLRVKALGRRNTATLDTTCATAQSAERIHVAMPYGEPEPRLIPSQRARTVCQNIPGKHSFHTAVTVNVSATSIRPHVEVCRDVLAVESHIRHRAADDDLCVPRRKNTVMHAHVLQPCRRNNIQQACGYRPYVTDDAEVLPVPYAAVVIDRALPPIYVELAPISSCVGRGRAAENIRSR